MEITNIVIALSVILIIMIALGIAFVFVAMDLNKRVSECAIKIKELEKKMESVDGNSNVRFFNVINNGNEKIH